MVQPIPGTVVDQLLAAIRNLMPIAGASCYFVDEQGRPFGHRLNGLSREHLQEYRHDFCERDPFFPALHQPSGKDIVSLEDISSQRDTAGYLEGFLHRYGYCDEVEMFFRRSDGRIAMGVGMIRDERSGRFRTSELELIAKVKPFLQLTLAAYLNTNTEGMQWRTSSFASQLTTREVEVVEHLLGGASNREIANLCNVTVATVKAHFFNIFDKTGVTSRTELVARILTQ
ncbi:helix-turn-helix transcriptional regulator [Aurantiacibacter flavus]|uniref:LuxR C-terminal-related transcriptional regulator n=1 Tax=Aurantiacibacter flavus TaxID=3145232 RepID=A0ABV0CV41_9SPHN